MSFLSKVKVVKNWKIDIETFANENIAGILNILQCDVRFAKCRLYHLVCDEVAKDQEKTQIFLKIK